MSSKTSLAAKWASMEAPFDDTDIQPGPAAASKMESRGSLRGVFENKLEVRVLEAA